MESLVYFECINKLINWLQKSCKILTDIRSKSQGKPKKKKAGSMITSAPIGA